MRVSISRVLVDHRVYVLQCSIVTTIERPWGETFDAVQIRDVLKKVRPKVLGIVHAETSTGAWQPVEELGALCHEFDALLLLDTVTSLGGVLVDVDGWGVDAVYSGWKIVTTLDWRMQEAAEHALKHGLSYGATQGAGVLLHGMRSVGPS